MKGRAAWGMLLGVVLSAAGMAAAPTIASADANCGSKENPCPLQGWMRKTMAVANSAGDMAALEAQFRKVAAMSPDKSWTGPDPKAHWDAVANAGAAAAKANDAAGVKAACKGCHDLYKDKYKAQYRTKAVP